MKPSTRNTLIVGIACVVAAGVAFRGLRTEATAPEFRTVEVTRGNVVQAVGATGTLEAVTTVQVGTQVSGTIASLQADFNSQVRCQPAPAAHLHSSGPPRRPSNRGRP